MLAYYPAGSRGTLMEAKRAAEVLAEALSDPKNVAKLAAASTEITIGICEATPSDRFTVSVDVDERGKLFITVAETG